MSCALKAVQMLMAGTDSYLHQYERGRTRRARNRWFDYHYYGIFTRSFEIVFVSGEIAIEADTVLRIHIIIVLCTDPRTMKLF